MTEMILDPSELMIIRYILVDDAILWDKNPKEHDLHTLVDSISKNGFQDPGKFEISLNGGVGGIMFGNGRTYAVKYMQDHKFDRPKGIGCSAEDDSKWFVPVLFGNDILNEAQAIAFALDHNLVGILGVNGITHLEATRIYDLELYMQLAIQTMEYSTTSSWDDIELLKGLAEGTFGELELDEPAEFEEHDGVGLKVSLTFSNSDNRQRFLEILEEAKANFYEVGYDKAGDSLLRFIENKQV